ncbi:hypothetical protein PUR28_17765 [Streptomyces sp. BE308]|uniref:hypothetical protein n=1 Tax=Streptomyces sp. BE308 TaxID=3002529 RepID=UPI002E785AA1|nr:hypothetical protein [Streptomyces sp. BE308]MEE1792594.1 hypothetical protein [Streptomyces sp. BE308]
MTWRQIPVLVQAGHPFQGAGRSPALGAETPPAAEAPYTATVVPDGSEDGPGGTAA